MVMDKLNHRPRKMLNYKTPHAMFFDEHELKTAWIIELHFGVESTKFRSEGDKIFAFKPQPDRFLSFFNTGKKVIVTNAFHKKSKKLPTKEKILAIKRMNSYSSRVKIGDYYAEQE